jgi:hypothetical protein
VASITRDDDTTTTLYELVFPAASLGLDGYESGMSIGIGVCVNDGDTEEGQGGQRGWSGWGPYAAVYGKTASATGLVTLVGEAPGGDLTLSEEDMKYDAQGASITADGDASDWADAEFKSQIPFEQGGELVLFEEYAGGTWSGPADHSSAVAFAWDAENLYLGIVVTDDTHQNGGAAWNGDSAQIVFANAAQDTVTHLYNYGLAGDEVIIHNERGPGGTVASITRDDDTTTTLYELVFPAASLGLDGYESGMSIGIGVCVNDGDTEEGQGGQRGWSGWGPYAAVYGKTASATGLVNLVGEAPGGPASVASSTESVEGPTIVDFGDLSGDASYEFYFNAVGETSGASTAIAGNNAFAIKLDQWNRQGVFGTTVFGVADNVFTAVEGKSAASVFDRDVHVVVVNDTGAEETRLYVDGDHVGVLAGNFELAGEGKVMGARISANTDPMGAGSVMHKWATYNVALTDAEIAALAAAAGGGDAPAISVVRNADGSLTVTFDGKLQAAPTVNGPWQDVDSDSPYTLNPDQDQVFGRAVK